MRRLDIDHKAQLTTEAMASVMPKPRACAAVWHRRHRPVAVHRISASISHHTHVERTDAQHLRRCTGCDEAEPRMDIAGAANRPTMAVNTTSDITRGFNSAK